MARGGGQRTATGRGEGSLREQKPNWLEALSSWPPRARTFGENTPLADARARTCGQGGGPLGRPAPHGRGELGPNSAPAPAAAASSGQLKAAMRAAEAAREGGKEP